MIEKFVCNVTGKKWEQNKIQISDQLRTYVCCTTCLRTFSLDDWNKSLLDSNLKNDVVAVQDDGSKSTFYQHFFLTKQKQLDFLLGINVDLSKTFHTCRISGHGLSPTDSRWRHHDWPHQSELNIKDVKVTLFDTAMPCGETSNRVHGSIVIQKSVFVRMESTRSSCVDEKCLLQQWCVQLGSWCGLVAVPRLWKWLFSFFFSFIRLVYGDTWAGKANGVINLAVAQVFFAFSFRPASPKNSTSLSNNVMISWDDLANIKISSANLKSKSGGKSSPRSNPHEHPSAHVRHFDIAHWSSDSQHHFLFLLTLAPGGGGGDPP